MLQKIMVGMNKKQLKVKKAPNVQGSVRIYFHNKAVEDVVLNNFDEVELFKRIGIEADDIKKSNLEMLVIRGDVVLC